MQIEAVCEVSAAGSVTTCLRGTGLWRKPQVQPLKWLRGYIPWRISARKFRLKGSDCVTLHTVKGLQIGGWALYAVAAGFQFVAPFRTLCYGRRFVQSRQQLRHIRIPRAQLCQYAGYAYVPRPCPRQSKNFYAVLAGKWFSALLFTQCAEQTCRNALYEHCKVEGVLAVGYG